MDKILLVTGASRGIGAATSLLAARQGWSVVVNFNARGDEANALVQRITDQGGRAMALQADVYNEAQVMAMFEQIDSQWARLSGLVNNAGVVDVAARLDEMTWTRWRRMFDINVIGSLLCAREAVRRMSTRHGGAGGSRCF